MSWCQLAEAKSYREGYVLEEEEDGDDDDDDDEDEDDNDEDVPLRSCRRRFQHFFGSARPGGGWIWSLGGRRWWELELLVDVSPVSSPLSHARGGTAFQCRVREDFS